MKRFLIGGLVVLGFATAGTFSAAVVANPGTAASTTTAPAPPATTTPPAPTATAPTAAPTTTAIAPGRATTLPEGVRVGGVNVGGLAHADAVAAVRQAFAEPVRVVVDRSVFELPPAQFASAYTATAIARARIATPQADVQLVVAVRGAPLRAWVAKIAARFRRSPVDATLTLRRGRVHVSPDRPGRVLDQHALTAKIVAALNANSRTPVRFTTTRVPAKVAATSFGSVILINRSLNRLELFAGAKPVRTFKVATGQAIYPTPKGTFHIVVKQRDPWWYPPTYDSWAANLKPVPPGPDNPLGTRWMGLSVPGVGIHGTDEPASIGYSESHGCIRMQVPDAEWLFEHVDVGTTVFIV